jgi:mono/diheme cytochrome c family protein
MERSGMRESDSRFSLRFIRVTYEEMVMVALLTRLLTAGLFACALNGAAVAEETPGDAANGKLVYAKLRCFTCHGRAGQGGGFNYPVPPLAALELPVEAFQAFLREPPNDMPAYSTALLSDKDAADMWAWLHSLPGRKPAKDFPLLNQ